MEQPSFDDYLREEKLSKLPGRTAFIDECGNFGFNFEREGTSKYYIICAVIAQNSELQYLHEVVSKVKNNNGFRDAEMKSSAIDNYKRRNKILAELLTIKFSVVLFVADKQSFIEKSPLTLYQKTFIKYLHNKLYNVLYCVYPKLKIIEDEIGTSEFQESFKKYVWEKSPRNLFSDYDFGYIDSKDSLLVQLADFVGGTISKVYTDDSAPNYLEMLKGKILCIEKFPNTSTPYFGVASKEDRKYDKDIFDLAIHRARAFIEKHEGDDEDIERLLQIALLKHLMFQVFNIDAHKYVSSYQLLPLLNEYAGQRIRPNYLYRRIIAPLRDSEVILASCAQGYKIPVSVEDIKTYLNQAHMIISPMLHRIEICCKLIKFHTDNILDVLDDPSLLKYKKYFD